MNTYKNGEILFLCIYDENISIKDQYLRRDKFHTKEPNTTYSMNEKLLLLNLTNNLKSFLQGRKKKFEKIVLQNFLYLIIMLLLYLNQYELNKSKK